MMKCVIVLILMLSTAVPAMAWDRYETTLVLATSADFITTEIGLRHPNIVEGNPLMRKRGVRIGAGLAQVVLTTMLYRKLRRDGHDKCAKAIILMPAITHAGAAGWNISVMARVSW